MSAPVHFDRPDGQYLARWWNIGPDRIWMSLLMPAGDRYRFDPHLELIPGADNLHVQQKVKENVQTFPTVYLLEALHQYRSWSTRLPSRGPPRR